MSTPNERPPKTRFGLTRIRESWAGKIVRVLTPRHIDQELWGNLEEHLITSDVSINTTQYLMSRIKKEAESLHLTDPQDILDLLKKEMISLLSPEYPLLDSVNGLGNGPRVTLIVGVNGVGKTTSIAKLAHYWKDNGNTVLLAACDTFRAGAVEQLLGWGQSIGVPVIAHNTGGDPSAVAYDALDSAKSRGTDVVIIDTAGRLHTNNNLMEEIRKLSRVLNRVIVGSPHDVLLVLDATTGQNGLTQARSFVETAGCTGVFLTKLDGTSKGGIAVSIAKDLGLPIAYVGTGESSADMAVFDANAFITELFTPTD